MATLLNPHGASMTVCFSAHGPLTLALTTPRRHAHVGSNPAPALTKTAPPLVRPSNNYSTGLYDGLVDADFISFARAAA